MRSSFKRRIRRESTEQRRHDRNRINYKRVASELGYLCEDYAVEVIRSAVEAGLIKSMRRTERLGKEDVLGGYDMVITDWNGMEHSLSIKSSRRQFIESQWTRPDIPVLFVELNQPPKKIWNNLRKIFPFLKKYSNLRKTN